MDLLITKGNQETRLSSLGFYNIDIFDSSASLSVDTRSVTGRNGFIYDGGTYTQKNIKVSARVRVTNASAFMQLQDDVNALLLDSDPFYVTKMYPNESDFYGFEVPGAKTGDIDLLNLPHTAWKYRWKVVISSTPEYTFLGKAGDWLKYDVSFALVTAEMPFGETKPKDIGLSGGTFGYAGTAEFSQLEYPYTVELTSSGAQSSFYLTIDGRKFTYTSNVALKAGDKFLLTGIETTLNGNNVNNRTNYEYFILKPNTAKKITYTTDFIGSIRILGFKEVYR